MSRDGRRADAAASGAAQHVDAREAFLDGLIDDAGMFPPARLPLAEALMRHAEDRRAPHAPLLARWLCPASQAGAVAAALAGRGQGWTIGVVADGAAGTRDVAAWRAAVSADLAAARELDSRLGEAAVDAVEIPLPAGGDVATDIGWIAAAVPDSGLATARLVVEVPLADDIDAAIEHVAKAAAGALPVLAKVRCGGATAAAVPADGVLARVIVACHDAGVMFKATAGLHHPHRQRDPGTGALQHGFFNLGAAVALLEGRTIDAGEVVAVLADTGDEALRLDPEGFVWRDRRADAAAIATTRRERFAGFGSCSIAEPVADLRTLGVL